MGTNPLDWPMDEEEETLSAISCASSVTMVVDEEDYSDMPPLIQASIAPYLEPAPVLNSAAPEFLPNQRAEDWVVTVNGIVFRHPRALLAYFRMVDLVNEVARYSWERIEIPPLSHETCHTILNHVSVENPVPEFEEEVRGLYRYVVHYAALSE